MIETIVGLPPYCEPEMDLENRGSITNQFCIAYYNLSL